MNSLTANFVADFHKGLASGTTANTGLKNAVRVGNSLAVSLASTSSGAGKANNGFGIGSTRTLLASVSENIDLQVFTNLLGETLQSVSKVRLFYVIHPTSSAASSITVGNAATPFAPLGLTGTLTLLPGELFIFGSPTTTGFTVSGGAHLFKVLNNDATNAASYEIGFLGEV